MFSVQADYNNYSVQPSPYVGRLVGRTELSFYEVECENVLPLQRSHIFKYMRKDFLFPSVSLMKYDPINRKPYMKKDPKRNAS